MRLNRVSDEGKVDQIMKKLHVVMLALVAVFAFSALLASTASAETTLLSEWLIKGNMVTTLTSVVTSGELLLADIKEKVMVLCSGELVGSVGPNGEDEVTKVFELGGAVEITLTKLFLCAVQEGCEVSPTANVSPEGLPWHTLLFLDTATSLFLDAFFAAAYSVKCNILGIPIEEECVTPSITLGGSAGQVVNVATGVEGSLEPASPNGACGLGGAAAGEIEPEDGVITKTLNGEILSVSE
jgi:hypothetical protein